MFGYIAPGTDKFSVTGTRARRLPARAGLRSPRPPTAAPRAMVPIGSYERVMPFDMLPVPAARADHWRRERAAELGALELDEEDLALCTYVCPGKPSTGRCCARRSTASRRSLMRWLRQLLDRVGTELREGRQAAIAGTRCGRRPTPSSTRRRRSRRPAPTCATRST
jgi:hypothetical protein